MKHFVDDAARLVEDALEAEILLGHGKVARLDGYPGIKVVVRTDHDRSKVAVVSGGGSGHEPAHVGFVGDGLLTAAVCGDVFASPSVDAVLAGIVAVTGAAGCLLVVKNYTGDRLNFGLAAARARALGLLVETVIVGDDVALPDATQPRGLAGTLFVHKVAGHLARAGATLAQVKEAAERVARSVVSIGLSLSTCAIPGRPVEARLGDQEVELGLGIHGEPGARVVPLRPVTELVRQLVEPLEASLGARGVAESTPLAVLVNDLGGVPPIEAAVATRAILAAFTREVGLVVGPARLMTSLDMKGLSVSALPLDPELHRAIEASVGPRAWPGARPPAQSTPIPLSPRIRAELPEPSADPARRAALVRVCTALEAARAELDALDAKVGDGDTGTTFATAAHALREAIDTMPFAEPAALFAAISARLTTVMGGTSGVLAAVLFASTAGALREDPSIPSALGVGLARVSETSGAKEGDRTMLDALAPAVRALLAGEGLAGAADAARGGAEATASMREAKAGRASYVRKEALVGVPDPGAVAVSRVFAALAG